jgi:hypothetical protein
VVFQGTSERGVGGQGTILGAFLYALTLHAAYRIASGGATSTAAAVIDDFSLVTSDVQELLDSYDNYAASLTTFNLGLNLTKTYILWKSVDDPPQQLIRGADDRNLTIRLVRDGDFAIVVGSPLGASDDTLQQHMITLAEEQDEIHGYIVDPDMPKNIGAAFLTECVPARAGFALRTGLPSTLQQGADLFDEGITTSYHRLSDSTNPLTFVAKSMIQMPRRDGGMSLTPTTRKAYAAASGSIAQAAGLIKRVFDRVGASPEQIALTTAGRVLTESYAYWAEHRIDLSRVHYTRDIGRNSRPEVILHTSTRGVDDLLDVRSFPADPDAFWVAFAINPAAGVQKLLSRITEDIFSSRFLLNLSPPQQAMALSFKQKHTLDWLIPSNSPSTSNFEVSIALQQRALIRPYSDIGVCVCTAPLGPEDFAHAYGNCVKTKPRSVTDSHNHLVRTLAALCREAGMLVVPEVPFRYIVPTTNRGRGRGRGSGSSRGGRGRGRGRGRNRAVLITADLVAYGPSGIGIFDLRVTNPASPSYVSMRYSVRSHKRPLAAARKTAVDKNRHYRPLRDDLRARGLAVTFTPLIMETSGAFHKDFANFVRKIARNAAGQPGQTEPPEVISKRFFRALSVASRRGAAYVVSRHAERSRFAEYPMVSARPQHRLPHSLRVNI